MSTGRFRKLTETEVFRGSRIWVGHATFEAPDGSSFEREVVHHPGAVAVVPLLDDGTTVLLVRQYRGALDQEMLELPAGLRDHAGEAPEETARRELIEEVGMRAGRLETLGLFHNSPGFCDEAVHLFLGLDLEPDETDRQGIEERYMTIERVPLDDIAALVRDRKITDAKTIIGIALAKEIL